MTEPCISVHMLIPHAHNVMLSKKRTVVQRVGGHLASYFALARGCFDHDDQVNEKTSNSKWRPPGV